MAEIDTTPQLTTLDSTLLNQHALVLLKRNQWSSERLAAYQQSNLKKALGWAIAECPYYKEKIGALVKQGTGLNELPVHTKRELMANFDRIVTDQRLSRSSGGIPGSV